MPPARGLSHHGLFTFSLVPTACVCLLRSLPARSTRWNLLAKTCRKGTRV